MVSKSATSKSTAKNAAKQHTVASAGDDQQQPPAKLERLNAHDTVASALDGVFGIEALENILGDFDEYFESQKRILDADMEYLSKFR